MFVVKLLSVILSVQFVSTLHVIEDKFLTKQLMDIFDDVSVGADIVNSNISKREAVVDDASTMKRFAAFFAPINMTRANHYWTRKRGRETTPGKSSEVYYTLYPTKALTNSITNSQARKKRETIKKLARLNKVSSRFIREIEVEVNSTTEIVPTLKANATGELRKPFDKSHDKPRSGSREKNFDRRFGRKQ